MTTENKPGIAPFKLMLDVYPLPHYQPAPLKDIMVIYETWDGPR